MTTAKDTPPQRSPGRRGAGSGTREAILDAARDLFAAQGFEAVSVRSIAARAGVDPGLIRHFFGDKESLFATTVADRTVIPQRIAEALAGPPESIGVRVADTYLSLWEDEQTRPIFEGLVRTAITSTHGIGMLLDVIGGRVQQTTPFPPGREGRMRGIALTSSHLFGVAVARYILRVPMLVDMPRDELISAIAPTLQRYLTSPDI